MASPGRHFLCLTLLVENEASNNVSRYLDTQGARPPFVAEYRNENKRPVDTNFCVATIWGADLSWVDIQDAEVLEITDNEQEVKDYLATQALELAPVNLRTGINTLAERTIATLQLGFDGFNQKPASSSGTFFDDFTDVSGTWLGNHTATPGGGTWTPQGPNADGMQINANNALRPRRSNFSWFTCDNQGSADNYIEMTFPVLANLAAYAATRIADAANFIGMRITGLGSAGFSFQQRVGGAFSTLASTQGVAGLRARIEVEGNIARFYTGTSGNWTQIGTDQDISANPSSTNQGVVSNTNNAQDWGDDFEAGLLGAAGITASGDLVSGSATIAGEAEITQLATGALVSGAATIDGAASIPGGPFDPSDVAGLIRWYDAQDAATVTVTGSGVSQWDDKSPSLDHATQTADASRPPYTGTIEGNPALDFDGAADSLDMPDMDGLLGSQNFTHFIVGSITAVPALGADVPLSFGNINTDKGVIARFTSSGNFSWELVNRNETGQSYSIGQRFIIAVQLDGTLQSDMTQWLDDVPQALTNGATVNLTATGNSAVGSSFRTGSFFGGQIGEIVSYNRAISTQEFDDVYGYLDTKWTDSLKANGALVSGSATISGTAEITQLATGTLVSGSSTITGEASIPVPLEADGALVSGSAVIDGTAITHRLAAGDLISGSAVIDGSAVLAVVAQGALASGSAQISGTAFIPSYATGALVSGSAIINGISVSGDGWSPVNPGGSEVWSPVSSGGSEDWQDVPKGGNEKWL